MVGYFQELGDRKQWLGGETAVNQLANLPIQENTTQVHIISMLIICLLTVCMVYVGDINSINVQTNLRHNYAELPHTQCPSHHIHIPLRNQIS